MAIWLPTNFGRVNVLATVEDSKVFTEGPAWGHGALYFTNVRAAKILKWDGQKLSIFRENSNEANGLHFDVKGDLWACEGSAGRVTKTLWQTGKIEVLANEFNSFPLAAPNDLCVDDKQRCFLSSRPGVTIPARKRNAVYRRDPDGTLAQVLTWRIFICPMVWSLLLMESICI